MIPLHYLQDTYKKSLKAYTRDYLKEEVFDEGLTRNIPAFSRRHDRQVISRAAKFYLFDVGVAGAIMKRHLAEERGELFGNAFEHFIFMEMVAHSSYSELDYEINFWRTRSGLEVDFVLGGEAKWLLK